MLVKEIKKDQLQTVMHFGRECKNRHKKEEVDVRAVKEIRF